MHFIKKQLIVYKYRIVDKIVLNSVKNTSIKKAIIQTINIYFYSMRLITDKNRLK